MCSILSSLSASRLPLVALAALVIPALAASAASPGPPGQGRHLFEREWTSSNPTFGSDGLGPLFNGKSCVACHHQGGVGGAGDARFNARTVGIVQMNVDPAPTPAILADLVATFHPGFVPGGNTVISSMPLHHHGGTELFQKQRAGLLSRLASVTDPAGGPRDAAEVREEIAQSIDYQQSLGEHQIDLQAKIFHRNTTPLFGAGVIDALPDEVIEQQARRQQLHAEISGRTSTLPRGGIGKLGWRANVATLREFIDQACANELGLQTPTSEQPSDATAPNYRNPGHDLDKSQVDAMTRFVAALPAPVRAPESQQDPQVQLGERVFESVGCAVCHTPDLGPAKGLYSDLLLHDMGSELSDPSAAHPQIVRSKVVPLMTDERITTMTTEQDTSGHYGETSRITLTRNSGSQRRGIPMRASGSGAGIPFRPSGSPLLSGAQGSVAPVNVETQMNVYYGNVGISAMPVRFSAARAPSRFQWIPLGSVEEYDWQSEEQKTESGRSRKIKRVTRQDHQLFIRHTIEPTAVTQEWRTPPLWGLRDSAPYLHDGRASTVLEAITLHGGEASGTRDRFLELPLEQREAVLAFLDTLIAPPGAPEPSDADLAKH